MEKQIYIVKLIHEFLVYIILYYSCLYHRIFGKLRVVEAKALFYIAILEFFVVFYCFSVNCSIVKQMLTRIFAVFVNFTVVNSRFLSPWRDCKPEPGAQNCGFASPPCRLKTQITTCFQTRMQRWQNTIFGFLSAQLDFLAIFSSPP